jgi:hypothetical protein
LLEKLYRPGVCDTFLLENSGRKGIRCIVVSYFTTSLNYNGSFIVLVRAEMNGAAANFTARRKNGLVHVMAPHPLTAEAGQQGGVDVHHAVLVLLRNVPQAQPPSLDYKVNIRSDEFVFDALAELGDVRKILLTNYFYIEARSPCFLDAGDL